MNQIVGVADDRAGMRCQNLEDALVLPFRLDAHHPSLPLNLNRLTGFDHLIENAVDVLAKVRGGKTLSHGSKRTPHVVRTSIRIARREPPTSRQPVTMSAAMSSMTNVDRRPW